MKYLVTGGAGFIGSHIVSALLQSGSAVRVLDNFSSGRRENLQALTQAVGPERLMIIQGDVRDAGAVAEAIRGTEIVFHEAAFVSVPESMEKPQECFDVNCAGTSILLEAARQEGVRRVILASSAAIYGDSNELPLTEQTVPRPLSPYAASKISGEIFAALYTTSLGLDVSALRYFNVYGPRQRPDTQYAAVVPIFIRQFSRRQPPTIFGDGEQTRDLIFVDDVVRANLIAAEHPAAPGQVFNVCTGRATRILDLILSLSELTPGSPPPVFEPKRMGDIFESVGSPVKAESMIGFRADASIETGLKKTLQAMQ
jgi:nucleoside-diphosphate-sugar epimerase